MRPRETPSVHTKYLTHFSWISTRKRPGFGGNVKQNISGPVGFPWWTPLEQVIVVVYPEPIREKLLTGLVPKHLATSGVRVGTQLATVASTRVFCTLLKAMELSA